MLLGRGIYNGMRSSLMGSSAVGEVRTIVPKQSPVSWRRTFDNDFVSFPVGYFQNGIILPMKYGGISCSILGSGGFTAAPTATANIAASITGTGTLSVYGYKGLNGACSITGTGSFTAGIAAKANLACTITIGAQPSAFDIAQAIWNAQATQYDTPGTMGQKLNGAGSAGDPWTTALPGSYGPGTAGYIMGNQTSNGGLTLAQFLALK